MEVTIALLVAASVTALGAIANYISTWLKRKQISQVEIKMGGVSVLVKGDLSNEEANKIAEAVVSAHVKSEDAAVKNKDKVDSSNRREL